MMRMNLHMVALCALCCLFSGCGCSREKKADGGVPSRMEDAVYTNRLVRLHDSQRQIAARSAAIRAEIKKLGPDAEGTPEYVALTNRLAQCAEEFIRIRQEAQATVRARLLKDTGDNHKENVKK